MSNSLAVKITADVIDLQTKMAIAKANVSGLTSELNRLARESARGTIDQAGIDRMQQLSGDLLAAREQARGYADDLRAASEASEDLGEGAEDAAKGAADSFKELFEQVASGDITEIPETLKGIVDQFVQLQSSGLLMAGAVGAAAAALGYLAVRAIESQRAIDQIRIGAQFAGNVNITRAAVSDLARELAKASNISRSEAQSIAASFTQLEDVTSDQIKGLATVVSKFATATQQDSAAAGEQLAAMFDAGTSAEDLAKELKGMTQEQINAANAADDSGDANQVFAAKLDLVTAAIDRSREGIVEQSTSMFASIKNFLAYRAAITAGIPLESVRAAMLLKQNEEMQKQSALLKQVAQQIAATPQTKEQTLKAGVEIAKNDNPISKQIGDAKDKVDQLSAAFDVARERGDQVSVDLLSSSLDKARKDLDTLQFGPALDRMRQQMSQLASAWDGTQSGMLQRQRQIAAQSLATVRENSAEYISIQTEISQLDTQIRQARSKESVAGVQEQIALINTEVERGALERIALETKAYQDLLSTDRLTAANRVQVQTKLNDAITRLNREAVSQSEAIAKSNADTDLAIKKAQLDGKKEALDLEVQAERITSQEKIAALKEFAEQEYALEIQSLERQLAALERQPVEYARVYDKIRELKERQVLEMQKLDRQASSAAIQLAKQQGSAWETAVRGIQDAEGQFISDMLTGRKSMSDSLLEIGGQMLIKELQADAKALTTRLLLGRTEQAATKAMQEGGILYHLLGEQQKTVATVTGQAARTTATTAGEAARTAASTAGAATAAVAAAKAGKSTVLQNVAKAFFGTYASVAQIPYVGWILAPAAASAAFAAVAAYQGLASLDVGAYNVPQDMVAQIHKGETVVPKNFAEGMREGGGFGGGGATIHVHAMDAQSVQDFAQRNRKAFYGAVMKMAAAKMPGTMVSRMQ